MQSEIAIGEMVETGRFKYKRQRAGMENKSEGMFGKRVNSEEKARVCGGDRIVYGHPS